MKKQLLLCVLVLSTTFSAYANPIPCDVKLKQRIENTAEVIPVAAAALGAINLVTGMPILVELLGPIGFTLPIVIVSGIGGYGTIRNAHKKKMLKILRQAEIGYGKDLLKLWYKIERKHPSFAAAVGFEKFASTLNEANKSGELCEFKEIPKRKNMLEAVLIKLDHDQDGDLDE